jgi:60 kDa SS-A/Ro ribonucleoprotein
MRTNTKTIPMFNTGLSEVADTTIRVAAGTGPYAAKQSDYQLLRRSVMTCMLWEKIAFATGTSVVDEIRRLVPLCTPEEVRELAIEARYNQQLRHVPLFLTVVMFKYARYRKEAGIALQSIIRRPDEITEWMAMYWKENGHKMLPNQAKKALAFSFNLFNEYQLGKWNRKADIRLIDALRMVRPKPNTRGQSVLFDKVKTNTLAIPYTWEVELSSGRDKKVVWTEMLKKQALGGQALLKNLRNMEMASVDVSVIKQAILDMKPTWLLPLDFLKAARYAPRYERELNTLMLKGLQPLPKLQGKTVLAIDMSGSMTHKVSDKSEFSRIDAAAALAMIAVEMCEDIDLYLTAGNSAHLGMQIPVKHGFDLLKPINYSETSLKIGSNGIFTRQFLNWIRPRYTSKPERIIIISDSQDRDHNKALPSPFGRYNYIVDISSNKNGVAYDGLWTSEVNGWSQHFIHYILVLEAMTCHST